MAGQESVAVPACCTAAAAPLPSGWWGRSRGLLLLEAENHAAAEALVRQDPMVRSGGVDWPLHGWVPVVGDLAIAGASALSREPG